MSSASTDLGGELIERLEGAIVLGYDLGRRVGDRARGRPTAAPHARGPPRRGSRSTPRGLSGARAASRRAAARALARAVGAVDDHAAAPRRGRAARLAASALVGGARGGLLVELRPGPLAGREARRRTCGRRRRRPRPARQRRASSPASVDLPGGRRPAHQTAMGARARQQQALAQLPQRLGARAAAASAPRRGPVPHPRSSTFARTWARWAA